MTRCSLTVSYSGLQVAALPPGNPFRGTFLSQLVGLYDVRRDGANFEERLLSEFADIPFPARTVGMESVLGRCDVSMCSYHELFPDARAEFAFHSEEMHRAVVLNPYALRNFWGVQVPNVDNTGPFDVDSFFRDREGAVDDDLFFSKQPIHALSKGAIAPALLEFILRQYCSSEKLSVFFEAKNLVASATTDGGSADGTSLHRITASGRQEATVLSQCDKRMLAKQGDTLGYDFMGNVAKQPRLLSYLSGVRLTILVYVNGAISATVHATLMPLSSDKSKYFGTHMDLSSVQIILAKNPVPIVYIIAFVIRRTNASHLHRRSLLFLTTSMFMFQYAFASCPTSMLALRMRPFRLASIPRSSLTEASCSYQQVCVRMVSLASVASVARVARVP